jgi:predicted 3-demethylubiquinone-9 3-methyltransferase (glyoxalase superfamily)
MPNAQIQPFLLFEGKAEEAMNLYISLFPGAKILELHRYGPNQAGKEGSIMTHRSASNTPTSSAKSLCRTAPT